MAPSSVFATGPVHRFGPFELDTAHRRLSRDGDALFTRDRHMNVLIVLVRHAPHTVGKERLLDEAWPGVAVDDNNLVQAIGGLREVLGGDRTDQQYTKTVHRVGYQFVMPVGDAPTARHAGMEETLAFERALATGRQRLETLNLDDIECARQGYASILATDPDSAAAHTGMANARLLRFESTRIDSEPDVRALDEAERHAREGCRLTPASADAWGTFALVRHRQGDLVDAVAAARKSVVLDPEDWVQHVRLAAVSWGSARLRATTRALQLHHRIPLAHWLASTVYIARGQFPRALDELRAASAVQDAQSETGVGYGAMGLHLLQGLVILAMGEEGDAMEAFERELARADVRHVHGRESIVNTHCAIGATHLRARRLEQAREAFRSVLQHAPNHPLATALRETAAQGPPRAVATGVDGAVATAGMLVLRQKIEEAAQVCLAALRSTAGSAGWMIPVDPLLNPTARRDEWAPVLALIADRAL